MNVELQAQFVPSDSLKMASESLELLQFSTTTHNRIALEYLVANFGTDHVLLRDYLYDTDDPAPATPPRASGVNADKRDRRPAPMLVNTWESASK